jgi:hypothetical protein
MHTWFNADPKERKIFIHTEVQMYATKPFATELNDRLIKHICKVYRADKILPRAFPSVLQCFFTKLLVKTQNVIVR